MARQRFPLLFSLRREREKQHEPNHNSIKRRGAIVRFTVAFAVQQDRCMYGSGGNHESLMETSKSMEIQLSAPLSYEPASQPSGLVRALVEKRVMSMWSLPRQTQSTTWQLKLLVGDAQTWLGGDLMQFLYFAVSPAVSLSLSQSI